jgi:secreted trypsin-like serine protease
MWPVGDQDRFHVLGLVRSAVGCARPGFPAMFTRVDRYIDWILSKLQ